MKLSVTFHITITTILLIAVGIMVFYNLPYPLVFFTVMGGQAWWIFTVYKVLTDDYTPKMTFDHWYEDHPIEKE